MSVQLISESRNACTWQHVIQPRFHVKALGIDNASTDVRIVD